MGNKDILKVLSKSDEKRKSCVVYKSKFRKIPPFTRPKSPQNHTAVAIFNRVCLRWVIKIFWKFYQNRMKKKELCCLQDPVTHIHIHRHDYYNTPPATKGSQTV